MRIKSSRTELRRTLCAQEILRAYKKLFRQARDIHRLTAREIGISASYIGIAGAQMTMMQKNAKLNLKMRLGLDKKSLIFIEQNRKSALFSSSNKQSARAFGGTKFTLGNPSSHSIVA